MGLFIRRSAAFFVDFLILVAFSTLGVWADLQTSWLHGYDGGHLGLTLFIVAIALIEALFKTSPGKALLGLRIHAAENQPTGFLVFLRAMVFWILFLGVGRLVPASIIAPFFSTRIAGLLHVALTFAVTIALPISVAVTKGAEGIHDRLSGLRVARTSAASEVAPQMPNWSSRQTEVFVAATLWAFSVGLAYGAVAEWMTDVSGSISRLARTTPGLLSSYRASAPSSSAQRIAETQAYFEAESQPSLQALRAIFPGNSVRFRLYSYAQVIRNHQRIVEVARNFALDIEPRLARNTRWIVLEFVHRSLFGIASVAETETVVFDRKTQRVFFAPEVVYPEEGETDTTVHRSWLYKLDFRPNEPTTEFRLNMSGGWDYASFDFTATPGEPASPGFSLDLRRRAEAALYNDSIDQAFNLGSWDTAVSGRLTGLFVRGVYLALLDAWSDAEPALSLVHELAPENTSAADIYAYVLFNTGQIDSAVAVIETGLDHDPDNPALWDRLLLIYDFLEDEEGFMRALDALYRVDPLATMADSGVITFWVDQDDRQGSDSTGIRSQEH